MWVKQIAIATNRQWLTNQSKKVYLFFKLEISSSTKKQVKFSCLYVLGKGNRIFMIGYWIYVIFALGFGEDQRKLTAPSIIYIFRISRHCALLITNLYIFLYLSFSVYRIFFPKFLSYFLFFILIFWSFVFYYCPLLWLYYHSSVFNCIFYLQFYP